MPLHMKTKSKSKHASKAKPSLAEIQQASSSKAKEQPRSRISVREYNQLASRGSAVNATVSRIANMARGRAAECERLFSELLGLINDGFMYAAAKEINNSKLRYYEDKAKEAKEETKSARSVAESYLSKMKDLRSKLKIKSGDQNGMEIAPFMDMVKTHAPGLGKAMQLESVVISLRDRAKHRKDHMFAKPAGGKKVARRGKKTQSQVTTTPPATPDQFNDKCMASLVAFDNDYDVDVKYEVYTLLKSYAISPSAIFSYTGSYEVGGRPVSADEASYMNFLLLGGAGVGKTRLAGAISELFSACGMLVDGRLSTTDASDFIGQYVGESAPKSRAKCLETLERVLFIDEAYSLATIDKQRGEFNQYGQEATTAIVAHLSQYKGQQIVIAAGYPKEMIEQFIAINEGMNRRFPRKMFLADIDEKRLVKILSNDIRKALGSGAMTEDAVKFLEAYIRYGRKLADRGMSEDTVTARPYHHVMVRMIKAQAGWIKNLYELLVQNARNMCSSGGYKGCVNVTLLQKTLVAQAIGENPVMLKKIKQYENNPGKASASLRAFYLNDVVKLHRAVTKA